MNRGVVLLYAFVSLIALFAYGADKLFSKIKKRRISEAVLLLFGLMGSAVGALLGMLLFRHKIRRWYFWITNLLGLTWQTVFLLHFL